MDCHRCLLLLMYKAKAHRDMVETVLVVRDSNGNPNSSPTFLFSIWGHPKISQYHIYQRIWMPHVGEKVTTVKEPGNEHGWFAVEFAIDHYSLWRVACFLARLGPLFVRFVGGSALGFHDIGSGSFGSLLKYSFLSVFAIFFLHLALLRDSFCRRFLIMCHTVRPVSIA